MRLTLPKFSTIFTAGVAILIAVGVIAVSMQELKWMVAGFAGFTLLALFSLNPYKKESLFFLLFFSLPVGLNFYLIHKPSEVFQPITGLPIYLTEIILYVLFSIWIYEMVLGKAPLPTLHKKILIPFGILMVLSMLGLRGTDYSIVIKVGILWAEIKCLMIYIYASNQGANRKYFMIAVWALLGTLFLQCFVGFAQKATGGHLGIGIVGESAESFRNMRTGNSFVSRVGGTVGSPNALADYLGLVLPLALSLLMSKMNLKIRLFVVLPIFGMSCLLLMLTFSRGGWLGGGIGLLVTSYLLLVRWTGRSIISGLLLLWLCVMGAGFVIAASESVRKRLFEDDHGAAMTRLPIVFVAGEMIKENPVLGVGLGNFNHVSHGYDYTREFITYVFPWPVHNEFILTASEQGLIALALLLFILIQHFRMLFWMKNNSDDWLIVAASTGFIGGYLAWCVHQQFEFVFFMISLPFWALMGLVHSLYNQAKNQVAIK